MKLGSSAIKVVAGLIELCNDLTCTLRKLDNLNKPMTHPVPTHENPSQTLLAQALNFFGAGVSEHIQIVIYVLLMLVLGNLAFILVYFFSYKGAKFSKQAPAEESKDKAAKQKEAAGHKCADAACKHTKHAESDLRVEEDENLVFDEQADVVFMQPGFNIKDQAAATVAKTQPKKANPQQWSQKQNYKQPYTANG